jgi:ubiquinone/menaquinone biosynthesis C-methylase UbiE
MAEPEHIVSARSVYDHSADQYVAAVGTRISSQFEAPLDRAVLDAFAELASSHESASVLDIGCGTGRMASFLAERGLTVAGVDVSEQMVRAARSAHPALRFDVGSLTALPISDLSITGATYWYSIIATPPAHLGSVWAELDRVLTADGLAVVAFQAGSGEAIAQHDAYGSSTTLTLYRHSIHDVADTLTNAGFVITAEVVRKPMFRHETTPQAFLYVSRSADPARLRTPNSNTPNEDPREEPS